MSQAPSSPTPRPTNFRNVVLIFVCTLSMITYLDRVCMSNANPFIQKVLGLQSEADLMWFFWAFSISYALFEVPTGWLGDVFGPRKTIIRIVIWWSIFTVLTGSIWQFSFGYHLQVPGTDWEIPLIFNGFLLLVLIRFMFGLGEAGAYPNLTRALHNWYPYKDRAFAQGAMWMSGRLMGGLTPLVWALLVTGFAWTSTTETGETTTWGVPALLGSENWRGAFFLFGALGVVWCIAFGWWFRDRPDQKPSVNAAERALILGDRKDVEAGHAKVPWGKLLTNVNLWMLCLMYFCAAYGWYFNITLLPSFFDNQYGIDPKDPIGAIYKGGPLWMGAITCLLGGVLSDRFIRRTGNRKWGRRLFGVVGHGMCAVCYVGCFLVPKQAGHAGFAFLFFLSISMAAFWNDLIMGSAWAVCQDIGKRYAAIVAGCMNTIGNLGGAVTILVTANIIKATQAAKATELGKPLAELTKAELAAGGWLGYQINFLIYAAVYVLAVIFWFRVDATKPVVPDEP